MSDYRVIIKIQNGRIRRAMDRCGIATASELARLSGVSAPRVGQLINLKVPARGEKRQWVKAALQIAEALQSDPEDLFTEFQQFEGMKKNVTHRDVEESAIARYLLAGSQSPADPLMLIDASEEASALDRALQSLTARQERVIRFRFGLGPESAKTSVEVAEELGLTRGRAWQIEKEAIRRLKHRLKPGDFRAILGLNAS